MNLYAQAENIRQKRRINGLPNDTKVNRKIQANPSLGGTYGYPLSQRIQNIQLHYNRQPTVCSKSTIFRYIRINPDLPLALRPTGNKRELKLSGENQFLLIIYRLTHPKASADEIRRFLLDESNNPVLFSRTDISRAEQRLGFTRKRGYHTNII